MPDRITIIRNPTSGKGGKIESFFPDLSRVLKHKFPDCELNLRYTEFAGHATQLAREESELGTDLCIAAGGDGTMHEVALGLIGSENTALGILPMGSGNGLARHLGLSMDVKSAFTQLLEGENAWMDAGRINGSWFFLAAGFGFEGVVAHRFARGGSRGFSQYILSSARSFLGYKPLKVRAKWNAGAWEGSVFTSTLANGAQYGNNAWIAPKASVLDGKLDWARILPFPFWEGPELFLRLIQKGLKPDTRYQSQLISVLSIEFEEKVHGHLDGEPVIFAPLLQVECVPSVLQVRLPYQATI